MFINEFQSKHGLTADGLIGKQTLYKIKEVYCIDTNEQTAHLVAQCFHESAGFKSMEENLNYSARALLSVFGKYFNRQQANDYERHPEKIANRVYANRMGNGDEESGDGWKYRGRGPIQLTGKSNYEKFSDKEGVDAVSNPDIIFDYLFEPAIFYFDLANIWPIARKSDMDSIKMVTKKINGGYNGLQHRFELTNKAMAVFRVGGVLS